MNTLTQLTQGQLAEARDWLADCFATCPAGRLSAASVTANAHRLKLDGSRMAGMRIGSPYARVLSFARSA